VKFRLVYVLFDLHTMLICWVMNFYSDGLVYFMMVGNLFSNVVLAHSSIHLSNVCIADGTRN
jgi:hypothetical protein